MKKKLIKMLCYSFDARLSPRKHKKLAEALHNSAGLRAEKKYLISIREIITRHSTPAFSPFFTRKVIDGIENRNFIQKNNDTLYIQMQSLFRKIVLVAGVLFITMISYNIARTGNFSLEGVLGFPKITLAENIELVTNLYWE